MADKRFFETQDACELAASIDGLRNPSREEARLRLTCAALTGILVANTRPDVPTALWAVGLADEVLALLYPEPKP